MITLTLTEHFAEDYSFLMALIDLIPVALFFLAGLILMNDLYNKMDKWSYAFLSTGTLTVLLAGLLKAIWKILCALNITDFVVFNLMLLPLQAFGFILSALSLLSFVKKRTKFYSFLPIGSIIFLTEKVPLEMTNKSMPFLILQTLGATVLLIFLIIIAVKLKNKLAVIFFICSIILMYGMGGLAATEGKMDLTLWNWLEELDNIFSQGTLFVGVYLLHKNGLKDCKINN